MEDGKPKWQRWATFNRLFDRCERVGERFDASLIGAAQRLGFDLDGLAYRFPTPPRREGVSEVAQR